MPARLCILLLLLAVATSLLAADWPIFRGDRQLRGVAQANLPDKPTLRWTFKAGDAVKSSPIIYGGVVYVGSSDGNLYALSAADGKPRWTYKTGGAIEAPPLALGKTVYVGSWDNHLHAIDVQTGQMRWKFPVGERIIGSANSFEVDKAARIVFGSYDNNLYCLDADTGQLLWRYVTDNYINGAPAVDDQRIVFGGCDEFLHVISLGGKELARIRSGSYVAGSAALDGDRAWVGNMGNQFICINLEKQIIEWTFEDKEDRAFPFYASPALTADRVVCGGRDRRVHCLSRADGKEVWVFAAGGKVDASPVVCGQRVIAASMDGRVHILDLADGHELWGYDIGAAVSATPALAADRLIVAAEDGNVYAFGPPPPPPPEAEAAPAPKAAP